MKKIFIPLILFMAFGLSLTAQERVYAPELNFPVDMATNQFPNVILDWYAVTGGGTGVIEYILNLDTDPNFGNPFVAETTLASGFQTENLLFGTTYYWRVQAKDGNNFSDWSEVWSFTVINAPVLDKPDDASEEFPDVELEWENIEGVSQFEIQFDSVYYWNKVATGTDVELFATAPVDENNGWTCGEDGTILHFDGTMWNVVESETTKDLLGLSFLDLTHGWAVGKSGTIAFYDGTVWAEQESNTSDDLMAVWFTDAMNGWAVGEGGTIIYFNGTEWADQSSGTSEDLHDVFFLDNSHGWAVGDGGTVLHFDGTEWMEEDSPVSKDLYAVSFVDANYGWAGGKSASMIMYTDGTWTEYDAPVSKDVYSIFFNGMSGTAVGKSGIMMISDGAGWTSFASGTEENLNSVRIAADGSGFAVGDVGVSLAYSEDAFQSDFSYSIMADGEEISTTVIDLMFGVNYFWRIRAWHDADTSAWSTPLSFYILDVPEIKSPDSGSDDEGITVSFKWKKMNGGAAYADLITFELMIDDNPEFNSPKNYSTSELDYEIEGLGFGTQYFWKLRAINANSLSAWTEVYDFTTLPTVELQSPDDGTVIDILQPTLQWRTYTGATGYRIQLSHDAEFNNLVFDNVFGEAVTTIATGILDRGAQYYWRVLASYEEIESEFSEGWTFTVAEDVGIDEPALGSLSIYPNPANDVITLTYPDSEIPLNLTIIDLVGKVVAQQELPSGMHAYKLNVSHLAKGIYSVKIDNGNENQVQKLVIR